MTIPTWVWRHISRTTKTFGLLRSGHAGAWLMTINCEEGWGFLDD